MWGFLKVNFEVPFLHLISPCGGPEECSQFFFLALWLGAKYSVVRRDSGSAISLFFDQSREIQSLQTWHWCGGGAEFHRGIFVRFLYNHFRGSEWPYLVICTEIVNKKLYLLGFRLLNGCPMGPPVFHFEVVYLSEISWMSFVFSISICGFVFKWIY